MVAEPDRRGGIEDGLADGGWREEDVFVKSAHGWAIEESAPVVVEGGVSGRKQGRSRSEQGREVTLQGLRVDLGKLELTQEPARIVNRKGAVFASHSARERTTMSRAISVSMVIFRQGKRRSPGWRIFRTQRILNGEVSSSSKGLWMGGRPSAVLVGGWEMRKRGTGGRDAARKGKLTRLKTEVRGLVAFRSRIPTGILFSHKLGRMLLCCIIVAY
jgi:hypothetical protein